MALSNIFGQNIQKPFQVKNAQNNAQAIDKKPEQAIAQAPVNIFGANPEQSPNVAAEGPGARAQEIIAQVQKMDKLA